MAGWGLDPVADDNKPFWLNSAEKAACYATAAGWAYRQPSGNEEILVAIRDLSTTLAGANLTSVFFDARSYDGGATGNVIIAFDEAITVGGGHTGVLKVDYTGTAAGEVTSSAGVAVTGETNQIRYQFTVPTTGSATPATYTTFSVAGTGYVQATDAAATLATVGGSGAAMTGTYTADAGGNLTDVKIVGGGTDWAYNETVSVSDGASGTNGRFTLTSVQGDLELDKDDDLELTNLTAITDTVGGGAITSLTTAIRDAALSTIDGTTYSNITVTITA